jgi:hypothetical protein
MLSKMKFDVNVLEIIIILGKLAGIANSFSLSYGIYEH